MTDPGLWEQSWTFNRSYNLLKYKWPSLFARRGAAAREKVVDAFVEYGENGGFDTASALAQSRANVLSKTGLEKCEVGRMAMSQSVGQFDNAATVSYAVLSYILRDPNLLRRIRAEIEAVTTRDGNGQAEIDIVRSVTSALSCFPCSMKSSVSLPSASQVCRIEHDYPLTIKSDQTQYLVRKGNFICGRAFLGQRFPERQNPKLFRAFGGGRKYLPWAPLCPDHLCPAMLGHS
jgi:hypothetical protein